LSCWNNSERLAYPSQWMQGFPSEPQCIRCLIISLIFWCWSFLCKELETLQPMTIVSNSNRFFAILLQLHFNMCCISINCVIHQLFDTVADACNHLLSAQIICYLLT
jgi:hypothetical protein